MKKFAWFWTLSLVVKLLIATVLPMTTDETYYWVWSLHPQLSYFDHPPFVAWLFWLGHLFQGFGNAVRWPAILMGHLTILVWYFIWRDFISSRLERFSWWFALALFTPLIGFGSIIVTPDLPVIFFWSLSLYFFLKVLISKELINYSFLGSFLGLGFCAKYHIVLFVLIALVYLSFEKRWKDIKWKGVLLTIFTGLIFSSPVTLWNLQNNFVSFQFQLRHGLADPGYEFYWTWSYILGQIFVIFPPLVWTATRLKLNPTNKLIAYFGWGPLVFFFLTSFKAQVEVNWPIIAYPAFFVLAVLGAKKMTPILVTCSVCIFAFLFVSSHLLFPSIIQAPDRLNELTHFDPLLAVMDEFQPLYADSYQMASWLWYKTKTPTYKIAEMSRPDFFDHFPQGKPKNYPYYIATEPDAGIPIWLKAKNPNISQVRRLENNLVVLKVEKE